jgi:hypothetical protein
MLAAMLDCADRGPVGRLIWSAQKLVSSNGQEPDDASGFSM